MAKVVLILGRSGSGKSRSFKNFGAKELFVVKTINKDLPFKSKFIELLSCDYAKINAKITRCPMKSIVIDDCGYLLTDEFIRRNSEKSYEKFNDMATNYYNLITYVQNFLPNDKIVYFIMHEEENEITGQCKPKTIGKMLDEKVCLEGLFTMVIRCVNEGGDHKFYVNNSGCAKTPEGMFDSDSIPNDLKYVDTKIREFYGIVENNETENNEENKEQ